MSDIPNDVRIAASPLTDVELAWIIDLITHRPNGLQVAPGWTPNVVHSMVYDFTQAAQIRGIQRGCRVVTQTIDLRS